MLASCLSIGAAAHAQAPASPVQTAPPAAQQPTNCAPMPPHGSGTGTGTGTKEGGTVGQSNETLGDKLAKSDGTLCPPTGVDPEIRAPTPDNSGKMPVIPPPGSPGGDPSVRPK